MIMLEQGHVCDMDTLQYVQQVRRASTLQRCPRRVLRDG